jgi:hypothetical protein
MHSTLHDRCVPLASDLQPYRSIATASTCLRRMSDITLNDSHDRLLQTISVTYVRFEVLTAVTIKNGVFWDVTPCGSCKNRRFVGTWSLLHFFAAFVVC